MLAYSHILDHTHSGSPNTACDSLLDLDVFVDAWRQNPTSTLHAAIFMNVLRLYIHVALIDKRPLLQVSLNCCLMESICSDPSDARRVNANIVMLVASVLDYCYDKGPKSMERWHGLVGRLTAWSEAMPAAFNPLLETEPDEENPFGRIVFANDIHGTLVNIFCQSYIDINIPFTAATHQYYCVARLLLINNAPPQQRKCSTLSNMAEVSHFPLEPSTKAGYLRTKTIQKKGHSL